MILIAPGYEEKVIDIARRALDDIPECREAEYQIRWNLGLNPALIIAFTGQTQLMLDQVHATPAVAVGLRTRKRGGELTDVSSSASFLEGDRLRDHILHSVHHYLEKHGIRVSLDPDEGGRFSAKS